MFCFLFYLICYQNSSVRKATDYGAGRQGFILRHGQYFISSPQLLPDIPEDISTVVKRPVRKAEHSLPSSSKVKNEWSFVFTSPHVIVTWCLDRDDFIYYLTELHLRFFGCEVDGTASGSHLKNSLVLLPVFVDYSKIR
jgi:hypothetical protein